MTAFEMFFAYTKTRDSRSSIAPSDHRIAGGRHDAARDQIFQMRKHGITGRSR